MKAEKIETKQFGAVWIASDGVRQCIGATEDQAIEGINDAAKQRDKWVTLNAELAKAESEARDG